MGEQTPRDGEFEPVTRQALDRSLAVLLDVPPEVSQGYRLLCEEAARTTRTAIYLADENERLRWALEGVRTMVMNFATNPDIVDRINDALRTSPTGRPT